MARNVDGRSGYSMDAYGQSQRGQLQGVHLFKPSAHVQMWRPTWKRSYSVFRFWPRFNKATGQFEPMFDPAKVQNQSDNPLTDFIRRYDCAAGVGAEGSQVTFILKDPTDPHSQSQPNPLNMLVNAVDRSFKNGQGRPHWFPLTQGQPGKGKALKKDDSIYFLQGFVLETDSKPRQQWLGSQPGDATPVIALPRSAGQALLTELLKRDPQTGQYVHQDILNLNGGCFAYFFQLGSMPHPGLARAGLQSMPNPQQQQQPAMGGVQTGRINDNVYQVVLAPVYYDQQAAIPHMAQHIASKWQEWDDILDFPTIEAQVNYLCQAGLPADMIMYALGEQFGSIIPAHVRQAAQNAGQLQQPMGGQYPPAAFPPAQQYPPQGYGQPNPTYPPQQQYPLQQQYPPAEQMPWQGQPQFPQQGQPQQYPAQQPQSQPYQQFPQQGQQQTYPAQYPQTGPTAPQNMLPPGMPPNAMPAPQQGQGPQADASVQGAYGAFNPQLGGQPAPIGQPYPQQQYPLQQQPQQQYPQQVQPQQFPPPGQYGGPQASPSIGAPVGPLPQPQAVTTPPAGPPVQQPNYTDPQRRADTVNALERAKTMARP